MKEVVKRALRTFLQAAAGYLAAELVGVVQTENFGKSALATLCIAAVAAGIAAVMNLPEAGNE